MADLDFEVNHVVFESGDILYAYTDGVTDARNSEGLSFSDERLIESISKPFVSSLSQVYQVVHELNQHIMDTDQFDDIAMLALRRKDNSSDEKHEMTAAAN